MPRVRILDTEPLSRKYRSTSTGGTKRTRPALTPVQKTAVKRIVNADKEKFNYQTAISGGEVSSTVVFSDLSAIAQGDDHDQRLGDMVKCTNIILRGNVSRDDGAAVDTFDNVRMVLFIWHPDDNTEPLTSETQILESATLFQHQPLQLEASKRKKFTVLYDSSFDVACRESGRAKDAVRQFHVRKKLKNTIYFNDAATTGRNKIYLMRRSFYASASGNESAINFVATLGYKQK